MIKIEHSSSFFVSQVLQEVSLLSGRMRTRDVRGIVKNGEGGDSSSEICLLDEYAKYSGMQTPGKVGATFPQKENTTKQVED